MKITLSDLINNLYTTVPGADYTGLEAIMMMAPFTVAIIGIVVLSVVLELTIESD